MLRRIPERELKQLRESEEEQLVDDPSDKLHDVKIEPSIPKEQESSNNKELRAWI